MIERLNWDSAFFGFETGLIHDSTQLNSDMAQAKKEQYKLIYLIGDENFVIDTELTATYDLQLVDRKVMYQINLPKQCIENVIATITQFKEDKPTKALYDLAYESGQFSRFKLDAHFEPKVFMQMYNSWIEQSATGNLADYIFISTHDNETTGMVTLTINDNVAHIGLIATSPHYQGKGIGRKLINQCIAMAVEKQCDRLEVTTQLANKQACGFYETCGFSVKSINNIYHLWF
jgi:dTDP-4-amino-4,6-dideoxy-D-galactose acyltransferase